MKRLISAIGGIIAIVVIAFIVGAQDNTTEDTSSDGSTETTNTPIEKIPHVGVLQLTSHPSLDAIAQGIIDSLEAEGYVDGETMTLDFQNAQGDQSNLNTMSTRFVNDDADLLIGIATPSAQALANATSEIPIILGAITDPENVGLVESNEQPGGNVTGVSDMTPVAQQIELIRQILPDATRLGIMYSSSEDNSILQGKMAEELAPEYGFEPVVSTVTSTNDVSQIGQQLIQEVDAIWVPNDNMIASAFPTLVEQADLEGIPIFPAVDQMVAQGGLATLGLNQYQLGIATGEMAAAVLNGTSNPATTPIRVAEDADLIINFDKAEQLNILISEELSEQATAVKDIESEGE